MNTGLNYDQFYRVLLNLRESFHSSGRFDDSNAKLDEIIKVLCIAYYRAINGLSFSLADVKSLALKEFGDDSKTAESLRLMFDEMAASSTFMNSDGTSVFGSDPSLSIQTSEDSFADSIVSELSKIDLLHFIQEEQFSTFDIVNECFGHFVRENFRNNKEDAQYMTPLEVARPYAGVVFKEMERDGYFDSIADLEFKVMDPTCGVGTLLFEAARQYVSMVNDRVKNDPEKVIRRFLDHGIIGQDKVDRMVRLSKVNAVLYGASLDNISRGNSIVGVSSIDDHLGTVDLIFTNPPFGAEFSYEELPASLQQCIDEDGLSGKKFDSELLLLYRCMALLKPGGYLAIVLPDSVFSSKGNDAKIRKGLLQRYDVQSVVELPAVAFAQAGTRTKTSILLIRKTKPSASSILMARCLDLGFVVKEKQGVPVKIAQGENEVEALNLLYPSTHDSQLPAVISEHPSITSVSQKNLIDEVLNPSFYSSERLLTQESLLNRSNSEVAFVPLIEVATIETKSRKKKGSSDIISHISVLHIGSDSTIRFEEVEKFNPISPGRECKEGDVLFSKLNPSIPRMTVVPPYKKDLVCSAEFEIMRPITKEVGAYCLCMILRSHAVQSQIKSLTSGTSSSHNRIKTEQLQQVLVPMPVSEEAIRDFQEYEARCKKAFQQKYDADRELLSLSNIFSDFGC